jgi:hypothetical protein
MGVVSRWSRSWREFVRATAEWVAACLDGIEGYAEYGDTPDKRVKTVLGKMAGGRRDSKERIPNKFIGKVVAAFAALNRPVEWESFYNHDLPLLTSVLTRVRGRERWPRRRPGGTTQGPEPDATPVSGQEPVLAG